MGLLVWVGVVGLMCGDFVGGLVFCYLDWVTWSSFCVGGGCWVCLTLACTSGPVSLIHLCVLFLRGVDGVVLMWVLVFLFSSLGIRGWFCGVFCGLAHHEDSCSGGFHWAVFLFHGVCVWGGGPFFYFIFIITVVCVMVIGFFLFSMFRLGSRGVRGS